jgi:hypothetical protein
MAHGPESAQSPTGLDTVSFATSAGDVGVLTLGTTPSYTDLTTQFNWPSAANAPVPFFDIQGRLNVVWSDATGSVYLATQEPDPGGGGLGASSQFLHQAWILHDLSAESATAAAPQGALATGQVAVAADGSNDLVALRTSSGDLVLMTVGTARPFPVTEDVVVGTGVLTDPTFVGAPGSTVRLAATTSDQHAQLYSATAGVWATTDLTALLKTTPISGAVAATGDTTTLWVTGVSRSNGSVELLTGTIASSGTVTWAHANLTTLTAANTVPGPALTGELAIDQVGTHLSVAGQASGWGDLFDYTDTGSNGTWIATDVSATGGSFAKTVGSEVSSIDPGGTEILFAGGVHTPAPKGVGIYDIPSSDLPHAINDGWPILADTGGLGTATSPWVNIPPSSSVANGEDFAVGDTIQTSHKRDGWLSFWTVSGPEPGMLDSPGQFQSMATTAGAAVAKSIDSYVAHGLGIKPDWVILDPEGFPDLHSQLDGFDIKSLVGNGSTVTVRTWSATTLATGDTIGLTQTGIAALNVSNAPITVTSATSFTFPSTVKINATAGSGGNIGLVLDGSLLSQDWTATIAGWRAGIASVDPTLNAGLYADEYQYKAFGLSSTAMPIFLAIAWEPNGASPFPISHSSNVLGYIEFGNLCDSTEATQAKMFSDASWNGNYNTMQFTGYCTP